MLRNANCDGNGPHNVDRVRRYPLGGGANLLLCYRCWLAENKSRYERATLDDRGRRKAIPEHDKWPQQNWFEAEVLAE